MRLVSPGEHRLGVQEVAQRLLNVVEGCVPKGFCHQLHKLEPHELTITVLIAALDKRNARLVRLCDEDEGEQTGYLPPIVSMSQTSNS